VRHSMITLPYFFAPIAFPVFLHRRDRRKNYRERRGRTERLARMRSFANWHPSRNETWFATYFGSSPAIVSGDFPDSKQLASSAP